MVVLITWWRLDRKSSFVRTLLERTSPLQWCTLAQVLQDSSGRQARNRHSLFTTQLIITSVTPLSIPPTQKTRRPLSALEVLGLPTRTTAPFSKSHSIGCKHS